MCICFLLLLFLFVLFDLLGDLRFRLGYQLPQRLAVGYAGHKRVLQTETERHWKSWNTSENSRHLLNSSILQDVLRLICSPSPHLLRVTNMLHVFYRRPDNVELLRYQDLHERQTAVLYFQAHWLFPWRMQRAALSVSSPPLWTQSKRLGLTVDGKRKSALTWAPAEGWVPEQVNTCRLGLGLLTLSQQVVLRRGWGREGHVT